MASMKIMEVKGELTTRLTHGFRCLPNQGNDMRWQYTNLLALVAKSDLLSFILSQLMGQHVPVNKFDLHMWKEVMNSDYAIC